MFSNKTVLITGGTGSLGKVLTRRLLSGVHGTPKKIIVFSRDEAKQHYMRVAYQQKSKVTDEVIYNNFAQLLEFRIGDVRSYASVTAAIRTSDIVINAAALKQVPSCEYFPQEAVQTNILGAENIVRAIRDHNLQVSTVVGVSTDKACKPVNVMGMTKALQERVFIAGNITVPATRFICVRYGNVLASRGSVIPLFHEQIRNGGPVTITTEAMTRFLLPLERAVDTIVAALEDAEPGETFVPRVPAARIVDVARALIGRRSVEISITGIRPGEKVHEIMVSEEEAWRTYPRGDYYAIRPMLPELTVAPVEGSALMTEYSSGDILLSPEETGQLLAHHGLLGYGDEEEDGELLR
ncbi:polysaccharide biosynthesis protein [Trichlorobacter lovleyi]|nr:polysaccharide biosynthesis protein [Trichlorobacter lovleyi]